jgi:hypothetical protein
MCAMLQQTRVLQRMRHIGFLARPVKRVAEWIAEHSKHERAELHTAKTFLGQ